MLPTTLHLKVLITARTNGHVTWQMQRKYSVCNKYWNAHYCPSCL